MMGILVVVCVLALAITIPALIIAGRCEDDRR